MAETTECTICLLVRDSDGLTIDNRILMAYSAGRVEAEVMGARRAPQCDKHRIMSAGVAAMIQSELIARATDPNRPA